jgi:hypothetical protein
LHPRTTTFRTRRYHRLFFDEFRGAVYLEFWTMANGGVAQFYKLVQGAGTFPIEAV